MSFEELKKQKEYEELRQFFWKEKASEFMEQAEKEHGEVSLFKRIFCYQPIWYKIKLRQQTLFNNWFKKELEGRIK